MFFRINGVDGNTDAGRHLNPVFLGLDRLRQGGHDLLGDHTCILVLVDILEHKDKLVPAETGHGIRLAALPLQANGDLLQQHIADIVAKGIVDGF